MSFYNSYGYGGGGMGGGQSQQMMSLSASSSSIALCAVAAFGALYMMRGSGTNAGMSFWGGGANTSRQDEDGPNTTATSSQEVSGTVSDGSYNVKYGGLQMVVDPRSCKDSKVGFGQAIEGDRAAWNLRQVPGRPGLYYVSSEYRTFRQGCANKYLTAPLQCKGSPTLDTPRWADRQYWRFVPTGDGKYQLRSASCMEQRSPSYVASAGSGQGGWNVAGMQAREGSPYSLSPWSEA